eukprot:EG_transcript_11364
MRPLAVLCLTVLLLAPGEAYVGFNFALMQQRHPLSPLEAATKFRAALGRVGRVKLFDYNPEYLAAFEAVGLEDVVVSVPNVELPQLAASARHAAAVLDTVGPFVRRGMRLTVAVGNEPLAPWYGGAFRPHLLPALSLLHRGVQERGWSEKVRLTVAFSYSILSSTYPPSQGAFQADAQDIVLAVARMLANASSPFFANVYSFSAYQSAPLDVPLSYALLETSHTVEGVTYPHLLAAQVAALRSALLRLDYRLTAATLPIVIGETGWPTAGHPAATPANARTFLANAVRYAAEQPLYLFEAFDEQRKSEDAGGGAAGDVVENHWGMLTESGELKFDLPSLTTTPSPAAQSPANQSPDRTSNTGAVVAIGLILAVAGAVAGAVAWQVRKRSRYSCL